MIIIIEGCGSRAQRAALSGSGGGGDGPAEPRKRVPSTSFRGEPARVLPRRRTRGIPRASAGGMRAVSGAKGRASPGSLRPRSMSPPPQLPRFCQGKCSVNFTGWDFPRGSLAPTSLVPLTPEMPLGVVTITESLFGVTAAAPHVPRGNYSPPSPGLLSGRSVLHCLSPVQRGCYPLPGAEGGFLRLPNLQECK